MTVPTCVLCPTPAFFDFGSEFLLCAECAAAMLKRFEILTETQDTPESFAGVGTAAAETLPPAPSVAVGSFDLLDTPSYVKRSAAA